MSCFLVPMTEAAVVAFVRKSSYNKSNSLVKLEAMLWTGSMLLCVEHFLHGEFGLNFYEMATNGVAMSILVTVTWYFLRKKSIRTASFAILGTLLMIAVDLGFSFL